MKIIEKLKKINNDRCSDVDCAGVSCRNCVISKLGELINKEIENYKCPLCGK